MNLIQQLQQSPKWGEFEEWYEQKQYNLPLVGGDYYGRWYIGLDELSFEFQKGVFEKFIESREGVFEQTEDAYCNKTFSIWTIQQGYTKNKSFEKLLIWYFNN